MLSALYRLQVIGFSAKASEERKEEGGSTAPAVAADADQAGSRGKSDLAEKERERRKNDELLKDVSAV